jgi:hypothetical protein
MRVGLVDLFYAVVNKTDKIGSVSDSDDDSRAKLSVLQTGTDAER